MLFIFIPLHAIGGDGERMYSSYSFSTSALNGGRVVSVTPRPRFTPGKGPPVPIVQEAGWASEPVWTQRMLFISWTLSQICFFEFILEGDMKMMEHSKGAQGT
jgi:hypothetical protein